MESAAEQNLKEVLMVSSFSIKERKEYFTKKWKHDHVFDMTLGMIAIVLSLVLGLLREELMIIIITVVCGFVFSIVEYNRMMIYVERNVFDEKIRGEDKKS